MAPTSLPEPTSQTLCEQDRHALLDVASQSIAHGLRERRALAVDPSGYSVALQDRRATFVTLRRQGDLRGCIGLIEAARPLIEDVANNAWSAAFKDPRFPPLETHELSGLNIHISVLSAPVPMHFTDEKDLLDQLRPGIDGLLLEEPAKKARGTFLPAVWETLPDRRVFWRHLKDKAGLAADYWSQSLVVMRYTAESVS